MSQSTLAGNQTAGTTETEAETEPDDAPTTLEATITTIVTSHVANGPADGLLAYDEFCAVTTVVTDTIARVATEDRDR